MDEFEEGGTNLFGCPEINSVFQGEVVSVQEYGAFIKIPGCRKNGLVHKSQISAARVENANEVLSKGESVWCKVVNIGRNKDDELKIGLSIKLVDQGSGKDLDPTHIETDNIQRRGKKGYVKPPSISLEAVYNTTCKKCGTKGHLAQDCFQRPGGKVYELLPDNDEEVAVAIPQNPEDAESHPKDRKRKHKKTKKHKKHKESEGSPPPKKKHKEGHRKKHKKHH